METEVIYTPPVFETVLSWDAAAATTAARCENCTVLLHDDLPDDARCGFAIFEDRVALCCHDRDTGLLRAIVDTDAPEAIAWAESVYEPYRREARPLDRDVLASDESSCAELDRGRTASRPS
nr:hypothetical protein [Haladaptatus halobius]